MKKFFLLLFFILIFSSGIYQAPEVHADLQQQIDNVKQQRDALLAEQARIQAELRAIAAQGQSLQGAVKTLDTTKKKLNNDLKITATNISAANLNIQKLTNNINRNQAEINTHESAIANAIQNLSAYDSHSLVFDVLTYPTLTQVWADKTNLDSLNDSLRQEIADLNSTQEELVANKSQKEEQKNNLISLKDQIVGQKKVVEETQSAKLTLLTQTKSQEAAYQKLLADNIAREKQFESLLFQYESQLKAVNPTDIPVAGHGALAWPLDHIHITQQFGRTSSSGRLYASGTHNGVDFGTPVGTAIHAVRGGVIEGTGNTDNYPGCYSYGRWILIRHDNGLSTIYGHLSASIVTAGQAVTAGQIIGFSGGMPGADGSGYSTGPHLHLGLFVSAGVQISLYSTSINCKGVSIPIANPANYLDPLAYLPAL